MQQFLHSWRRRIWDGGILYESINTTLSEHFSFPQIIAKIIGKSTFHVSNSVFPNEICEVWILW